MSRRINVILSDATLRRIDRLTKPGGRSRFIDNAVQHFIATQGAEALRRQLEYAVVRDRDLDRQMASP